MDFNPYSPPGPPERGSVRRNWPAALATVAGIVAAVVLAGVTFVVSCVGVGTLLFNDGDVQPVMAAIVSLGLGLIAAFGMLVFVVRMTFRLLEQDGEG